MAFENLVIYGSLYIDSQVAPLGTEGSIDNL